MAKALRQLCLFGFAVATPLAGQKQDPGHSLITIKEIDGRAWLADSKGKPFFAHGITHARNLSAKLDYQEFSTCALSPGLRATSHRHVRA